MLKPSLAAVFALSLFSAVPLLGCTETVIVHEPGVRHRGGVPFRGVYQKYAESTFKHGRRVRVANSGGAATVRVEHGRVTYDQTYVSRGEMKRVIQVYSFSTHDMHPMGNGEYEIDLTFQHMTGDTSGYSPDQHNPKLEARRTSAGWKIPLLTTDSNGVVGIVELQ